MKNLIQKYQKKITVLCLALSANIYAQSFVTCDVMGQLGNQFFQIAAATSLALDNDAIATFPCLIIEKDFNIPLNYSKIFYHINTTIPEVPIEHVYIEPQFPYKAIPFKPNMTIRGWFQSEKYFRHHKSDILALFAPHKEISDYLHEKYGQIVLGDNTVSIHYRSYELEDPQHTVYYNCDMKYYTKAINQFPQDSLFIVFANDLEWCKNNFSTIDRNFVFIEGESHYHDLYLMSMCKHNIICNSSFSWWGAYLNLNPEKKVIAPAAWFMHEYEPGTKNVKDIKDLVPPEWIKITPETDEEYV